MDNLTNDNEYKNFIVDVATKIKQTQVKLAVTVNRGLLHFYFEFGGMISQKQQKAKWGARFIENMAKAIQKLVIKDVVLYSERKISTTKNVVDKEI